MKKCLFLLYICTYMKWLLAIVFFSMSSMAFSQTDEKGVVNVVLPGPSFNITPNPVIGNYFNIDLGFKFTEFPKAVVVITNVLGQTVYTHSLTAADYANGFVKINVSESKLDKGIYLVQIKSGEANKTLRLVIR